MHLTELFTAQLEWEADRCRKALQNVPEGRNDAPVPALYGPSADEQSFG